MPLPATRALIVFAGICTDVALATDFCAYRKKFSRAGIQTTCLSGTDISATVNICKTLKFGREDLNRTREEVFTRHEANGPESHFYELVQRGMFKRRILSWLEDVKCSARKGDRIVVIICAHGQSDGGVILKSRGFNEVLTQVEISTKLDGLVPGVRLLLVNEACYSGSWAEAMRQHRGSEVLYEAASEKCKKSYNYRSTSDNIRCSLFAAAFVQELEINPEGQIRQHTKRIASEISHVGPSQLTTPPEFATSTRSLWNYQINHFILTPSIVAAIESVPATQERHEERLTGFQFARDMWRRMLRASAPRPATANADFTGRIVQQQMDSMDADGSALSGSGSGLYSACQLIKRKEAPLDLQEQVIQTIIWQKQVNLVAVSVIEMLVEKRLIESPIAQEDAQLIDIDNSLLTEIAQKGSSIEAFVTLEFAPEPQCLGIYYPNSASWIIKIIAINLHQQEESYDLMKVLRSIKEYLDSLGRV